MFNHLQIVCFVISIEQKQVESLLLISVLKVEDGLPTSTTWLFVQNTWCPINSIYC